MCTLRLLRIEKNTIYIRRNIPTVPPADKSTQGYLQTIGGMYFMVVSQDMLWGRVLGWTYVFVWRGVNGVSILHRNAEGSLFPSGGQACVRGGEGGGRRGDVVVFYARLFCSRLIAYNIYTSIFIIYHIFGTS